ncbi:MAG TPA: hypothetical protein VNZ67_12560, partial [bacterium]|nr:hypothetical protein [bacterium]
GVATKLFTCPTPVNGPLHLAFDTQGAFGNNLLVLCESPAIGWQVNSSGQGVALAGLSGVPGKPVVAPASWGSLAGQLIVPNKAGSAYAVDAQGNVQSLPSLQAMTDLQLVPENPGSWGTTGVSLWVLGVRKAAPVLEGQAAYLFSGFADRLLAVSSNGSLGYAQPSGAGVAYSALAADLSAAAAAFVAPGFGPGPGPGAWVQEPYFSYVADGQAVPVAVSVAAAEGTHYDVSYGLCGAATTDMQSGTPPVMGLLGQIPGQPVLQDGVYHVQLNVTRNDGSTELQQGYYSKGPFRYDGSVTLPSQNYNAALAVDPASGHVFVAGTSQVMEYDTQKNLVATTAIPDMAFSYSCTIGQGLLYVRCGVFPNLVIRSYALPSSPGRPLGALVASVAMPYDGHEMQVFAGKLYVADNSYNLV